MIIKTMIINNKIKKLVLGFACVAMVSLCFSPRIQAGYPWLDKFKQQIQQNLQELRPYAPHVVCVVVVGCVLWKVYQYRQRKKQGISHTSEFKVVDGKVYDNNGTQVGKIDESSTVVGNEIQDQHGNVVGNLIEEMDTMHGDVLEPFNREFDENHLANNVVNHLLGDLENPDESGDGVNKCNQQ